MLKSAIQNLSNRFARNQQQERRDKIEAWSLHFGREAAELWVQAQSARDTARLSNA
jgi:hypothetical protein